MPEFIRFFTRLLPLDDPTQLLILCLGLAGSITLLISALATHKNRVLGASLFTSAFFITQALILQTPATAVASILGMTRNSLALAGSRWGWLNHWGFAPVFIAGQVAVFTTLNDFTHFQWWQVVPLTSGILAVLAPYFSVLTMKIIFSFISASWLTYEFLSGMYGQMVGETLFFTMNTVAIIVLIRAKLRGVTDVPDLDTAFINTITSSIPVQKVEEFLDTATGAVKKIRTDTRPVPVSQD